MNFDSSAFVAEQELIDAFATRSTTDDLRGRACSVQTGRVTTRVVYRPKGTGQPDNAIPHRWRVMSITAFPGSLLGLPALVGNEPYTMTATAYKSAELGFVTREDFYSLMLSDPTIAVRVLRVLAAEVRTARHAISDVLGPELKFLPAGTRSTEVR